MARSAKAASWWRWLVTVTVLGAVILPAVRDRDGYPLSTYPVYATARPDVGTIHTAIGVTAEGHPRRLSLPIIADSDDPLIAEDRVADAVRESRADRLCADIARRAREAGLHQGDPGSDSKPNPGSDTNPDADSGPNRDPGQDPITSIEVVDEELDFVLVAAEQAPPIRRNVHARCPVEP